MAHDEKRHGATLFAALDIQSGLIITDCMLRHRARKFLAFLRQIDRTVTKPHDMHLVHGNHATRKTPEVQT